MLPSSSETHTDPDDDPLLSDEAAGYVRKQLGLSNSVA